MKLFLNILIIIAPLLANVSLDAQPERFDVFSPIGKYIIKGDAESLAAWLDDNLELTISDQGSSASRNQAKQILRSFFAEYTPQEFHISHTAEKANMKYALGSLSAGGETFSVTIFVRAKGNSYKIQELKIERM
ncbi:MAG TPA: hypothetical protein DHU72_00850 [Rikenellaceae bacterium]|nr:hypothetical protein [Rikenellaceae bacterium]HCZ22055.1 hypothetical protein [Rikenellaceae bacterium]